MAMPEARRPAAEDMPGIFTDMLDGSSLTAACRSRGIDPGSTIHFIDADEALRQQYARARSVRGDGYGEKVADVAQRVLDGEIPPDAGRAAMDGFKWTAARMSPKGWGDKLAHEHTGKDGGPIQTADLSKLNDEQLAALERLMAAASGTEGEGE